MIRAVVALLPAFVGGAIGFYGTPYACAWLDDLQGNPAGGGYMTIGWLFWLITIPVGFLIGLVFGIAACLLFVKKPKDRPGLQP